MTRLYDKEFKLNSIKLYEESGQTIAAVAQNLGIPKPTLSRWIRAYAQEGYQSFPGTGHPKACDREMVALKKELYNVRLERDICVP